MFHTIFSLRCLPPVEVAPSPRRTSDFGHRTSDSAWSRSGSALVIVLGMLSVLLLMGVAFSVTMRTERAAAANMRHAAVARHILDSALARTMADLDRALEDQGDLPVPTGGVIVTVSQQPGGEASVNPLSPEAALHIPADQLVAAVFTNAQWLPIYGDVRINGNTANDPVRDDSPVGRYAFVVLNGCGYLDPNVVGASNRLYGLSPCEIDITGEGGRVLGITGAGKADKFLEERDSEGHFVTMRDFLRPTVTNLLGYKPMNIDGANKKFPTNSFFVGSLALDDLAPPTGKDKNGYPIRKPKFSLRDPDTGELKKASKLKDDPAFLEAMTNSFLATKKSLEGSPLKNDIQYFHDSLNDCPTFERSILAARNFLEMIDDDVYCGGTQGHKWSDIGTKSESEQDEYLKAFGVKKFFWDRLPCVEPVPMLDNLIIVGYDPENTACLSYDALKGPSPDNPTEEGPVTGIVFKVSLSLLTSSAIYPGWNVPEKAKDKYTFLWHIENFMPINEYVEAKTDDQKKFITAFEEAINGVSLSKDIETEVSLNDELQYRFNESTDFTSLANLKFSITIDPVPSISDKEGDEHYIGNYIPEEFGASLRAFGVMGKGNKSSYKNNVVQVVPSQMEGLDADNKNEESFLYVYLTFKREHILDSNPCVLGATYALDPRFAYKLHSWIYTPYPGYERMVKEEPGMKDEIEVRQLVVGDLDTLNGVNFNPLSDKYLRNPFQAVVGGKTLVELLCEFDVIDGGASDEMRSTLDKSGFTKTVARDSAYSVFIDPSASEDSEWAFTRVGQLGFIPIGTYRTIALMDGFDNTDNTPHVEVRQRVLDYFTMNPPRDEGSSGSDSNPGDPVKTELFTSRVGINPPRFPEVNSDNEVVPGDYNLLPLTAAFNGCPLREWDNSAPTVDWDTAADLAELIADSLDRDDEGVRNADKIKEWEDEFDDAEGVTRSLSVLGRSVYDSDVENCVSIDEILRDKFPTLTANDREGVIRNTAEMLTTRQQLFTILLKADSYTPMSGFSDASHGMSLASVQVIAHIWRDPEPLRDADGRVILDDADRPIHAWMLLDMYQF